MRKLLLVFLLGGLALSGADLSGKWSGKAVLDDSRTLPVELTLAQSATGITGQIGRADESDRYPIERAKLDGSKLTFQVTASNGDLYQFEFTAESEKMEGLLKRIRGGETGNAKLTFERAKP